MPHLKIRDKAIQKQIFNLISDFFEEGGQGFFLLETGGAKDF